MTAIAVLPAMEFILAMVTDRIAGDR